MTRNKAIRNRINERKDRAVTLATDIYRGDETLNGAWRMIANGAKVLIVAGRKFIKDECFTRASSITYTIILSLVPMLTVGLAVYSLYSGVGRNEKELVERVQLLLDQYSITMNIAPIIETILGLVDNAGKIGGISAAVMIFSATALFRSLENSLNVIWKVKKGRLVHLQIIFYWAALTVGVILLASGTYVAARISALISPLSALIGFLAPFAIIWLLFLLLYISLPNTKVPFRPAALGASFTGAVWVLFIMGFAVYTRTFAGSTLAVYGALAGIPLFLLMVYASSLIILYGAEVAYTLMYPATYRSLKKAFSDRDELHAYRGIALLSRIYRKFESGEGPTTPAELAKAGAGTPVEIDTFLKLFLDGKLIMLSENGSYLPSASSARVGLNDILDAIMNINLSVPAGKSQGRPFLARLFGKIESSRRSAVGALTLKDVIEKE